MNQFINRGTNYITNIGNNYDYGRGSPGAASVRNYAGKGGRGDMGQGLRRDIDFGGGGGGVGGLGGVHVEDISSTTTISMAVPELLVGNILGKNVSFLYSFNALFFVLLFSIYALHHFLVCLSD